MPLDKVKPLKLEDSTSGTELDIFPTELNPVEDYIATKGIAFENLDTFLIEKIGRTISVKMPDITINPIYLANGEIDYVEYFNNASQITANRIARVDFTYSGVDPQTEVLKIYDSNGSTVLRTITRTFTYTNSDITNITVSTT